MTDNRDHGDECPCDEHGATDIAEAIRLIEYDLLNRRTGGPGDDAVVRRVEVARLITALRQGESDRARIRDLERVVTGTDGALAAAEAQLAKVTKERDAWKTEADYRKDEWFKCSDQLKAAQQSLSTARKNVAEIRGHAVMANNVIRLGRGANGNSRVKVATCLHHIERLSNEFAATLSQPEGGIVACVIDRGCQMPKSCALDQECIAARATLQPEGGEEGL